MSINGKDLQAADPGRHNALEILGSALDALQIIGRKLETMRKLATWAADPECPADTRQELNQLFARLEKEIDSWAEGGAARVLLKADAE